MFIYLWKTALPSKELQNFLGILQDFGVRGVGETGACEQKTEGGEADNAHDNKDLEEKLMEAIRDDSGQIKSESNSREEPPASFESDVTSQRKEEPKLESSDTKVADEIIIKEKSFYSHINQRTLDPRLSGLGKFHRQGELYQCDICDYKTRHKKHVLRHKITVHVKLKFERVMLM